jgi:hypothetical protein
MWVDPVITIDRCYVYHSQMVVYDIVLPALLIFDIHKVSVHKTAPPWALGAIRIGVNPVLFRLLRMGCSDSAGMGR